MAYFAYLKIAFSKNAGKFPDRSHIPM